MTAECLDLMRYEDVGAIPNEVDRCFEMEPQRRFDGMWRHQLEAMVFCEGAETTCPYTDSNTWVTFASGDYPKGLSYPGMFRVSFLGRKTEKAGHYGHMGMSEHEIIIDRLLAITEVEDPTLGDFGRF